VARVSPVAALFSAAYVTFASGVSNVSHMDGVPAIVGVFVGSLTCC
jgi:hypothetical protein